MQSLSVRGKVQLVFGVSCLQTNVVEYCWAHAYDDEDEHEEDDEDDVGVEKRGELRVRSKYAISTMRF